MVNHQCWHAFDLKQEAHLRSLLMSIYFTTLRWIMNDWDWFETLKTQLLRKCIWILFLLWKWIKYTFALFVLTICIKKMYRVRSIAMTNVPDLIRVAVVAPIGNSDHSSLLAVISMALAVPNLCVSRIVFLKHQVN